MRAMRILYLHQYFNTPSMAGGTRSYDMATRLVQLGHEVQMVTTWREPTQRKSWYTTTESGVTVHWLPVEYANQMSYSRRIRAFCQFAWHSSRKARALPADVIFATSTPLTIAVPALYASWRKDTPFVFEVRDMWPDVPIALGALSGRVPIRLARQLEMTAYRRAAHIVALAPGMRDEIAAKGIPKEKITVIPNGSDMRLYATAPKEPDPRREHEWLGDRKLVLYAGTISTANGVDYLVHLAERTAMIDPEIRFVVFGSGRSSEQVRQLAAEKKVLNKTLFMFEPLPKERLVRWCVAADMHLALMAGPSTYLRNAVNNKFFEALAAGKPIANNFDGWQTQVAAEADIGVRLDAEDYEAAARILTNALHDEAWLAAASARSRALGEGRFNRDLQAKELERVLLDAADARGRPGKAAVGA